MGKEPFKIMRVLAFQEGGIWLAQCLEYDIVAQSKTLKDLPYAFALAFVSHLAVRTAEGQEAFEGVPRAPQKYWEIYNGAMKLAEGEVKPFASPEFRPVPVPIAMPDCDMRISA